MRNAYLVVDPKIHSEDAIVVRDVLTLNVVDGAVSLTFQGKKGLVDAVYPRGTWFYLEIGEEVE